MSLRLAILSVPAPVVQASYPLHVERSEGAASGSTSHARGRPGLARIPAGAPIGAVEQLGPVRVRRAAELRDALTSTTAPRADSPDRDRPHALEQRGVIELAAARGDPAGSPVVVGRLGDAQGRSTRPAGKSWASMKLMATSGSGRSKYALAARRTSLTRRSSAFLPGQPPVPFEHVGAGPVIALPAIGLRLADPVPQGFGMHVQLLAQPPKRRPGCESRYSRSARSRRSSGYFLGAGNSAFLPRPQDRTSLQRLRRTGEAQTARRSHSAGCHLSLGRRCWVT